MFTDCNCKEQVDAEPTTGALSYSYFYVATITIGLCVINKLRLISDVREPYRYYYYRILN